MSSFPVAVVARLCPPLLWHSRGSWLLPHMGQAAPGLAFPSDLTMLDLRSVALKAWCLDAAEQTECPSLCLCPSKEPQPRLPWVGAVCIVIC